MYDIIYNACPLIDNYRLEEPLNMYLAATADAVQGGSFSTDNNLVLFFLDHVHRVGQLHGRT